MKALKKDQNDVKVLRIDNFKVGVYPKNRNSYENEIFRYVKQFFKSFPKIYMLIV